MSEAHIRPRQVSSEKYREWRLRAEARHPEKIRARQQTHDALKRGKLIRQPCERCGEVKSEAHHDDYSKPLDVRWLCQPCHVEHHKNERYRARGACKRGHQFSPENLIDATGPRRCRQCAALNRRARYERSKSHSKQHGAAG